MDDRSRRLRRFFASFVAARAGVRDPRIEAAFAAVPRERFAGPGPWSIQVPGAGYLATPDDDPAYLYHDSLVAIDAARGINIGEPSLHARCLDALALRPGDGVVQVGAGVGYYTAVLAELVGLKGHVQAYEVDAGLAARAQRNLAPWPWAEVEARSGIGDHLPAADAVYVNAGITQPSWSWLDALRPAGRLLFPLQPERGFGAMLMITRPHGGMAWPARFVSRAGFIACTGLQDASLGRRLQAAFAAGGWEQVRSFRIDDSRDDTCWFADDGWWLSTAAAREA